MASVLTREQAAAAVAAAVAERDTIQANLLDLDGSFGKRLLAGATLIGETRRRWEAAAAAMTSLWETFNAYSAVVDRAAGVLADGSRLTGPKLTELVTLEQYKFIFGWILILLSALMLWQTTPGYLAKNKKEQAILKEFKKRAEDAAKGAEPRKAA